MGHSEPRPQLTKQQLEQVEDLYRREATGLETFAHSLLLGHTCEPKDLVQTTFQEVIRAWAKVGLYGPEQRRRWLHRVLKNKAIDLWRQQRKIDVTVDVPHQSSRPDDTYERAAFAIALAACWTEMERMPPVRRAVAFLVWGESWTSERVAEHLGVVPSTVRGHLREARRQLRAAVGHLVPCIDDEEEQELGP